MQKIRAISFMVGFPPKITDLVFADDAVIFAESLEVLVTAIEALREEAKPLGFEVSWLKTKVQVFGDLLDETVQVARMTDMEYEVFKAMMAGEEHGSGDYEAHEADESDEEDAKLSYKRH
ncbi:hypothetical protein GWK47_014692 [Chionoecetes opilio]|uniref:Reverse transcriptase domain-containing protein n=1 Tax=Chionoecetes opilio TaxID=41210 RepID=A0A8J5CNA1_CHIOP|nr:hypothetical protein GWK47_014692 [Chionoecetes opilio]